MAAMNSAASGCGAQNTPSAAETTQAQTEAAPEATAAAADPTVPAGMADTIKQNEFEGVIYAVENGKAVASFASGTLENGEKITIDSPMPLGSVSKQFCAAAVLLLQEQGKLSVTDTLDKYFPEYADGKKLYGYYNQTGTVSSFDGEQFNPMNSSDLNKALLEYLVSIGLDRYEVYNGFQATLLPPQTPVIENGVIYTFAFVNPPNDYFEDEDADEDEVAGLQALHGGRAAREQGQRAAGGNQQFLHIQYFMR